MLGQNQFLTDKSAFVKLENTEIFVAVFCVAWKQRRRMKVIIKNNNKYDFKISFMLN